jgi:hypothetical protein
MPKFTAQMRRGKLQRDLSHHRVGKVVTVSPPGSRRLLRRMKPRVVAIRTVVKGLSVAAAFAAVLSAAPVCGGVLTRRTLPFAFSRVVMADHASKASEQGHKTFCVYPLPAFEQLRHKFSKVFSIVPFFVHG